MILRCLLIKPKSFVNYGQLRLFSSLDLENEIKSAKPFSEIPKISGFEMIKRNMPGQKYHNQPQIQLLQMMRDEFGDIVRLPGMFGQPESVMTFRAEDFEKVLKLEKIAKMYENFAGLSK